MEKSLDEIQELLYSNGSTKIKKGLKLLFEFIESYLDDYKNNHPKSYDISNTKKKISSLYNKFVISETARFNDKNFEDIREFITEFKIYEQYIRKHPKRCPECRKGNLCSAYKKEIKSFDKFLNKSSYADFFTDIIKFILTKYFFVSDDNTALFNNSLNETKVKGATIKKKISRIKEKLEDLDFHREHRRKHNLFLPMLSVALLISFGLTYFFIRNKTLNKQISEINLQYKTEKANFQDSIGEYKNSIYNLKKEVNSIELKNINKLDSLRQLIKEKEADIVHLKQNNIFKKNPEFEQLIAENSRSNDFDFFPKNDIIYSDSITFYWTDDLQGDILDFEIQKSSGLVVFSKNLLNVKDNTFIFKQKLSRGLYYRIVKTESGLYVSQIWVL